MTYYPTGALPSGQTAAEIRDAMSHGEAVGPRLAKSVKFYDGPRIQIGPFNLAEGGSQFTIPQKTLNRPEGQGVMNWLRTQLGAAADKHKACGMSDLGISASMKTWWRDWTTCATTWKTWSSSKKLPIGMWKGQVPLVKTMHPTKKEVWGVYLEFKANEFTVRWKKVPVGLFRKIWNAIVDVVSFIIDTVEAMFDLFKMVACAMAQQNLSQLSAYSAGTTMLSAEDIIKYRKQGLTDAQIKQLKTNPTSANTALVGKIVSTAVCGPVPNPVVGAQEGIPSWMWLVAVAGGIGALGLWTLNKAKK